MHSTKRLKIFKIKEMEQLPQVYEQLALKNIILIRLEITEETLYSEILTALEEKCQYEGLILEKITKEILSIDPFHQPNH